MKNSIKTLEIKNFKSIKNSKIIDCKRINIFIGKPNVGKSNILEAISLLGSTYSQKREKYLSDFIRYESFENLFYDNELGNKVEIISNIGVTNIRYHFNINYFDLVTASDKEFVKRLNENGSLGEIKMQFLNLIDSKAKPTESIKPFWTSISSNNQLNEEAGERNYFNPIKKYDFVKKENFANRYHFYLLPPHGDNLFTIVQHNKKLYKELTSFFKEYKLELVMKIKEAKLEIQKKIDGVVYSYPYSTIADTLQRFIFYTLAIETNQNSVLLFEEPEAHSFPPYIRKIAQKIIDSKENQFFITTHSPYILNTIVENCPLNEIAVFVTDYDKFQTRIKPLSQAEIENLLNYGSDIFSNLK